MVWSVEYSASQHCLHIDLLGDAIRKNRDALANREHPDFVLIGVFMEEWEADAFAAEWRSNFTTQSAQAERVITD